MKQPTGKIVITIPRNIETGAVSRAINTGLMENSGAIQDAMQQTARRGKPRHFCFITDPTLTRYMRDILAGCPFLLSGNRSLSVVFNAANVRMATAVGKDTLLYFLREEELGRPQTEETQRALVRMAADQHLHAISTRSLVGRREVLPAFAALFIEVEIKFEASETKKPPEPEPRRPSNDAPTTTKPNVNMSDALGRGPRVYGRDSDRGQHTAAFLRMQGRTSGRDRRQRMRF